MKATLEFTLPEESEDFDIHMRAVPMYVFIEEFGSFLRRKYKHEEPTSDAAYAEYEAIRDKWFEMVNEADL